MTTTNEAVQMYRVYIKATPEAIWDAITKPEWTERYGYTGLVDYDLRPGGEYKVRPPRSSGRRARPTVTPAPTSSSTVRCWRPTRRAGW